MKVVPYQYKSPARGPGFDDGGAYGASRRRAGLKTLPYFALANRFSISAQFTTLHHAATYSFRRF